ncbi:GbsR/MarR family transcriptional regulator [Hazenella sp. IB182357]|uniref:HTH-type transcriptional regulator n=1 Tax=Polycladospora coralii TaxID=2771432 RepID=A0A926N8W9_9BACL|nr:GbsR/MarR family transcriptional regulator [Polycladospora coralii]MBD1371858.1 GbsR/MarR family transcriptional regulator [Polycladospora coralii]
MAPHSDELEQARNAYISSLSETMEMYGLSPSMGRLFGIMFFHDEPMTLDDMRSLTGMSKTSMSTGIRTLSQLKLVHKKWQKGVRKDLYVAEHDQFRSFLDFFAHLWEKEIQINQKPLLETEIRLQENLKQQNCSEEEQIQIKRDLEKLYKAKQYYAWLGELVEKFKSGDIFNYVPVNEDDL